MNERAMWVGCNESMIVEQECYGQWWLDGFEDGFLKFF
jgi:hypothetical protein